MKTENKKHRVKLNELAQRSGYSRQAISSWTTAGLLQRVAGKYDLVASLEAIKRHEAQRGTDGSHDVAELRDLKRQLLEKKIAKLDHELNIATGKTHDKQKCCESLTLLFSAESRELHNLGRRLAAQFPEAPRGYIKTVDSEIDSMILRLKRGMPYSSDTFCPKCNAKIDELRLEPLPEDQQPAPVASVPAPTATINTGTK